MKHFTTIEKLDTGILYILELTASLSVLLLAFGLIASMANVLTKGSVLTDNIIMQRLWAWTQCIAIDASVAGTIIRTFRYHAEGEQVKTWLYGLLSALLLFTAAIVSNIEAVQQTLNLTLDAAYMHVFVPVELLIWIRSIAIVLLIVAHAMRHVSSQKATEDVHAPLPQSASLILTPELLSELRVLLAQTTVSEEQAETPQITETATGIDMHGQGREEQTTHETPLFPDVPDEDRNNAKRKQSDTMNTTLPPNHPMSSAERHQGHDVPIPTEQQRPSLMEAALMYAQNGWPVFPLHGKLPYKDFHWREDATTNAAQIETWWREHPKANVGLVTGKASGVIILDMDPRNGGYVSLKQLQQRYGDLPQTRTSRTAHGGQHKFFLYPEDGNIYPNTVQLANLPGLDIRGEGGYVVLPPSTLYNRLRYIWAQPEHDIAPLPGWLHELLPYRVHQPERIPQEVRFAEQPGEKWLTQALTQAREGNRNHVGFHLAYQLRDDGLSEAQARSIILAYADRLQPGTTPYTHKEALASLRSAYSRPSREPARRRERS